MSRRTYYARGKRRRSRSCPDIKEGEISASAALGVAAGKITRSRLRAELAKNPDPVGTLWRSCVCEAAIIATKGPIGTWGGEVRRANATARF